MVYHLHSTKDGYLKRINECFWLFCFEIFLCRNLKGRGDVSRQLSDVMFEGMTRASLPNYVTRYKSRSVYSYFRRFH